MAAERIGHAVIADIHHDIEVVPAHRLLNDTLCLAGTKTGKVDIQQICFALITGKSERVLVLAFSLCTPFYKVVVYLFPQCFTAFQGNDAEGADGNGFQIAFFFFFCHKKSFLLGK